MDTPEELVAVLPTVHPVDVEVMGNGEEDQLQPNRPARQESKTRKTSDVVKQPNDEGKNNNTKDIALGYGVQGQIIKETLTKDLLPVRFVPMTGKVRE